MADIPDGGGSGGEGDFGFLTHKLGPLPLWIWGIIGVGGYYLYTKYKANAAAATAAAAVPATVNVSGQLPSQPQYGASTYTSNSQWEGAAINYLVGESIPPDQASSALWNYLNSKVLTTQEQKDVNLAIEGIGPPPTIPGPATVAPVTKPPAKKPPAKKPPAKKPPVRKPPPKRKPRPVRKTKEQSEKPSKTDTEKKNKE